MFNYLANRLHQHPSIAYGASFVTGSSGVMGMLTDTPAASPLVESIKAWLVVGTLGTSFILGVLAVIGSVLKVRRELRQERMRRSMDYAD